MQKNKAAVAIFANAEFAAIADDISKIEGRHEITAALAPSPACLLQPFFDYVPHFQNAELAAMRSPETFIPLSVRARIDDGVISEARKACAAALAPSAGCLCVVVATLSEARLCAATDGLQQYRRFLFVRSQVQPQAAVELLLNGWDVQAGVSQKTALETIARLAGALEKARTKPVASAFRSRGTRRAGECGDPLEKFWIEGLLQIPGLEREAVRAVALRWKNPAELISFIAREGRTAAVESIADADVTRVNGTKKLGRAMAKR